MVEFLVQRWVDVLVVVVVVVVVVFLVLVEGLFMRKRLIV
ncbi:hypothetical protein A2U01_0054810 [Trifolium medium]|uniref:Uncharacterized protein n=1 Tax=Trifolium medium TaxID=97028 RepID=A0A392RAG5_9FABA|nr:hypothetical protein [Trifolium medium]